MGKILVVSPHPDDETLGCGGTLLAHRARCDELYWVIVTDMSKGPYEKAAIDRRESEIESVTEAYQFRRVFRGAFAPAGLDSIALSELVRFFSSCLSEVHPTTLYLPFPGDVHSDHQVVFQAASSCTKWFRYPSVERVLCYETISETDFGVSPLEQAFRPQVFHEVSEFLDQKIEIMKQYHGEMGEFPFPRSEKAIRALAAHRGASSGYEAAEAFVLLRERISFN